MKIRTGFVSNSSSSSFCIYKKLMNDKQIEEFKDIIKQANNSSCDDETYIGEDGDYFIGSLSMHNETIISYLRRNFKTKVWADYC